MNLPHAIPYQGSKRKLAPMIGQYLPEDIQIFYEPFCGSGAMTIYAAYHRLADRFVLGDTLEPIVSLLREIVEFIESQKDARVYRGADDRTEVYLFAGRRQATLGWTQQ